MTKYERKSSTCLKLLGKYSGPTFMQLTLGMALLVGHNLWLP